MEAKKNKNILANRTLRKYGFILSLVIIPIINFAIFWVYVNFDTILLTFIKFNGLTGQYEWNGLQNYISVFQNMIMRGDIGEFNAFINSFRAILINLIIFPITFFISYSFFRKIRFHGFFQVVFFLPNIISLVVLCMLVRQMFSSDYGPIALLFEKILGHPTDWIGYQSDKLWGIITIFCIWAGLGGNSIVMCGAMRRIPEEIFEAARLDGVGFWQEMITIVLPLILPSIGVFFISIITSALSFTMQPMLIAVNPGIDNKYMTIGWYIFTTVEKGSSGSMIRAACIGITFSLILLPIIIATRLLVKKVTPEVEF